MTSGFSSSGVARPRIGAVVVTFHPDAHLERRLGAIMREVTRLLVVDNSADPDVTAQLSAMAQRVGAELISNSENEGLGAALNRGFTALLGRGYEWAVAFDQDSTPQPGLAVALLRLSAGAAVVGSNWYDEARPEVASRHVVRGDLVCFYRRIAATTDLANVTCVIASGSLFHLPTWRDLGGFDAGLFLDLVDSDYCLRARAAGHAVRVAAGARLAHRRGAKRRVTLGRKEFWPSFMPASRLYYLFRNRVLLLSREILRHPHWVTFEIVFALKNVGDVLAHENAKGAKLYASLCGLTDGLLGRSGRRERRGAS